MTWNYYDYNILLLLDCCDFSVIEECGEDIDYAKQRLSEIRAGHPENRYKLQQIHSIARIIA